MLGRRWRTVPAYLLATLVVTALLPALLALGAVATLVPGYRGALPTLVFAVGYLWCDTLGMLAAGYVWLRHRRSEHFLTANYRLQFWWTGALKRLAETAFRLTFHAHGQSDVGGPPALVLARHASIADAVMPIVFYARRNGVVLRCVLERELLNDPCLDIVGNRLPNLFVDRDDLETEQGRRGVAARTAGLGPEEGLLLYPESARFSPARRTALQVRYADDADLLAQLERWPDLLPPRLGGFLAMLSANPGRDLVFCAHHGLEGSSRFSTLLSGDWIGARVGIKVWRVPFAEIPTEAGARVAFLFEQWDRMQHEVAQLREDARAAAVHAAGLDPAEVDIAP